MSRKQKPWCVPVTVYTYDRGLKRYVLSGCMTYQVPTKPFPATLDCKSAQVVLRDNVELMKSTLRAPAVIFLKGTEVTAFCASGEEWASPLPSMREAKHRIVRAFEMKCVNYNTHLINYRLRGDGMLVLAGTSEINCGTFYVPETMSVDSVKSHVKSRAESLRKMLRDRRLIVELSEDRTCVYSIETMHRRHVMDAK